MSGDAFRTFVKDSPLQAYLATKHPGIFPVNLQQKQCTINIVIALLNLTIFTEHLADKDNPDIIFCNKALAQALNVTILLQSQMSKYITLQLPAGMYSSQRTLFPSNQPLKLIGPIAMSTPRSTLLSQPSIWPKITPYYRSKFWVNPSLLQLLKITCPKNCETDLLSYPTVYSCFLHYLSNKLDYFKVPNNDGVYLIRGDPLEQILGMRAFGKNQMDLVLKRQLILHLDGVPNPFLSSPLPLRSNFSSQHSTRL